MKSASKGFYTGLLVGTLLVGTVFANPPADPPRQAGIYYYYSDQEHQDVVGMEAIECDRSSYFFYGTAGPYRELNQPYFCPPIDW